MRRRDRFGGFVAGGTVLHLIERIVFLEDHLAAARLDHLTCVRVEQVRPHIVGRRQGEPLAAVRGSDAVTDRTGFSAMLAAIAGDGVRTT